VLNAPVPTANYKTEVFEEATDLVLEIPLDLRPERPPALWT
jgi:hypothetical protein